MFRIQRYSKLTQPLRNPNQSKIYYLLVPAFCNKVILIGFGADKYGLFLLAQPSLCLHSRQRATSCFMRTLNSPLISPNCLRVSFKLLHQVLSMFPIQFQFISQPSILLNKTGAEGIVECSHTWLTFQGTDFTHVGSAFYIGSVADPGFLCVFNNQQSPVHSGCSINICEEKNNSF